MAPDSVCIQALGLQIVTVTRQGNWSHGSGRSHCTGRSP